MRIQADIPPRTRWSWAAGLSLLTGLLAQYGTGYASVLMHGQGEAWQAWVFPVTMAVVLACSLGRGSAGWWKAGGIFTLWILLTVLALAISWQFHDFSWDGMTSRALLVRWISEGFPAGEIPTLNFGHILSAYALEVTGNWNAGKAVNLLLPIAGFCLVAASLTDAGIRHGKGLALLAMLNPVVICQISTFQVDGHVAVLLTILLFSLSLMVHQGGLSLPAVWAALAGTACLALAKNSGIFYAGIVWVIFALSMALRTRSWRPLFAVGGVLFVMTAVFGLAMRKSMNYGALSLDYVRRATSSGPAYGVGGGASQIEEFASSSKLKQFLASYFSYTEIAPTEIHWKPPFWLIRREIRVFEELTPDPRAGGFGPLYGTALLVSWGALLAGVMTRSLRPEWHKWFFPLAIVATAFPSQVWWARWVPQLWLLALVPLMMIAGANQPTGKLTRALAGLSVLVLAVNLGLIVLYYGLGMVRAQRVLDSQLVLIQKLPQPVSLFVPRFTANRSWLQDAGVQVEAVGEKPPVPRMKIVKTTSWVGLTPGWAHQITSPQFLAELRKRDLLEE